MIVKISFGHDGAIHLIVTKFQTFGSLEEFLVAVESNSEDVADFCRNPNEASYGPWCVVQIEEVTFIQFRGIVYLGISEECEKERFLFDNLIFLGF